MKSVFVERVIRTIKLMIAKTLYKITGTRKGRYTNILHMLINRYNNTPHKGIDNNTPHLYYNIIKISKIFKYKNHFNFSPFYKKNSILKENSQVRVSRLKETVFNWSNEIFFVERVRLTNPITYILRDKNNEIISGVFYREELQKA